MVSPSTTGRTTSRRPAPGTWWSGSGTNSLLSLTLIRVTGQISDHFRPLRSQKNLFFNVDFSIEINALCGTYEGPATSGEISYIFCSDYLTGKVYKKINFLQFFIKKNIKGRYLTVQRDSNETSMVPLNFLEMNIYSSTMDTEWKTVQIKKNKVGFNQECPESHSYAFDWVTFSNFKLAIVTATIIILIGQKMLSNFP